MKKKHCWANKVRCLRLLRSSRGETGLDGARDKKVWRPVFEPEVFRKQMKKVCATLLGLYGALCSDLAAPC